jgi:hypothetical protein
LDWCVWFKNGAGWEYVTSKYRGDMEEIRYNSSITQVYVRYNLAITQVYLSSVARLAGEVFEGRRGYLYSSLKP